MKKPPADNEIVTAMRRRIRNVDSFGEITRQAEWATQSLRAQQSMSTENIHRIDNAHLEMWTSFSIHDNALDTDCSTPLSFAEALIEQSRIGYLSTGQNRSIIEHFYTRALSAIAWEQKHIKSTADTEHLVLPSLHTNTMLKKHIQDRTAIHLLPSALVFSHAGISADGTSAILGPYLFARQLADDLLDWRDDLHAGRLTYVVQWLCRELNLRPGTYSLFDILPDMKRLFFFRGVELLSTQILDELEISATLLAQDPRICDDPALLTRVITPLSRKITDSRHSHRQNRRRLERLRTQT